MYVHNYVGNQQYNYLVVVKDNFNLANLHMYV